MTTAFLLFLFGIAILGLCARIYRLERELIALHRIIQQQNEIIREKKPEFFSPVSPETI